MDQGDAGHRYVQKMRKEGYTEHDIREALKDAGWTEEQIEAALAADADGPPPAPPPRERPEAQQRGREPIRPKPSDGSNIWVCVVVGCLGMLLIVGVVAAAIMVPTYTRAREKARQASCLANLKQIGLAANMYAQDYNGLLPPPGGWPDRLYPYIKNGAVFTCPSDQRASGPSVHGQQIGYAMNGAVGGLDINTISNPAAVKIHFDGTTVVGGVGDAAFRHNDGANAAYVDGHAKWIDRGSWSSVWTAPSITPTTTAPGSGPPSQPAPAQQSGDPTTQSQQQTDTTEDAQ
jgi:prepilin-type processing-associated H-X9-DG protein